GRDARDRKAHPTEALPVSWLQTVRSAVNRWEIDNTEHFTVAFYFARLGDATFAMLEMLGLNLSAAHTSDMYVRFQRELRVGDIFHIDTGVIDLGDDSLLLGHKIFDSGDGALTTTVEFRLAVDGLLRAGDLIVVKSAPLHIGNSSMRIFHQMLDARTGTRVAALDQLGVLLDLDVRRPTPLPDWMKERAKALVAPSA